MPPTPQNQPDFRRPVRSSRGFTLLEMIVVISIILILVSLLIPVVGKMRAAARAADVKNQVVGISAAIQSYFADYKAYPGPVPNSQLRTSGIGAVVDTNNQPITPFDGTKITQAENLYMGLLGGLETVGPGAFRFNFALAGAGPRALGTLPKKGRAYIDNANITRDGQGWGRFVDENGVAADDTPIPEIVDRFTDPMPILYLRARTGTPGVVADSTSGSATVPQQYDLIEVIGYTSRDIGVGKSLRPDQYKNATPMQNGLRTVNYGATIRKGLGTDTYPFDLYAALLDPNIGNPLPSSATNPQNTPRQKDAYILISAGNDRVYGTDDDITNFGSW
jgi:prepilin-type N-terminal cleavage/methylation domain-containing protein